MNMGGVSTLNEKDGSFQVGKTGHYESCSINKTLVLAVRRQVRRPE